MSLDCDEDIVLGKIDDIAVALERLKRVADDSEAFESWMRNDLYALYLQRTIETCVDIANHLIAEND